MKIDHFEEFVYLAETLSFTKTARRFYTNRSVISRHVSTLEAEFGVRLLERDTHSVRITPQGEIFCREARSLVESYQRLQRNMRTAAEKSGRLVRVGYLRNAARPFIVRFSRYVKEHADDIALSFVDMRYEELRRALDDKSVDIAFTMDVGQNFGDGWYRELVYEDCFYVIVDSTNPLIHAAGGVKCSALSGKELLVSDSFACPDLHGFMHRMLNGVSTSVRFRYCNDVDTMCLRVQMEGGIALQCGYNLPTASDGLMALPLLEANSVFSLVALRRDDLDEHVADICLDAFLHCRASLEDQGEQREVGYALPLLT